MIWLRSKLISFLTEKCWLIYVIQIIIPSFRISSFIHWFKLSLNKFCYCFSFGFIFYKFIVYRSIIKIVLMNSYVSRLTKYLFIFFLAISISLGSLFSDLGKSPTSFNFYSIVSPIGSATNTRILCSSCSTEYLILW